MCVGQPGLCSSNAVPSTSRQGVDCVALPANRDEGGIGVSVTGAVSCRAASQRVVEAPGWADVLPAAAESMFRSPMLPHARRCRQKNHSHEQAAALNAITRYTRSPDNDVLPFHRSAPRLPAIRCFLRTYVATFWLAQDRHNGADIDRRDGLSRNRRGRSSWYDSLPPSGPSSRVALHPQVFRADWLMQPLFRAVQDMPSSSTTADAPRPTSAAP